METSFYRNPVNTREFSFPCLPVNEKQTAHCASLYANAAACLFPSPKLLVYGLADSEVVSRDLVKLLITY